MTWAFGLTESGTEDVERCQLDTKTYPAFAKRLSNESPSTPLRCTNQRHGADAPLKADGNRTQAPVALSVLNAAVLTRAQ